MTWSLVQKTISITKNDGKEQKNSTDLQDTNKYAKPVIFHIVSAMSQKRK